MTLVEGLAGVSSEGNSYMHSSLWLKWVMLFGRLRGGSVADWKVERWRWCVADQMGCPSLVLFFFFLYFVLFFYVVLLFCKRKHCQGPPKPRATRPPLMYKSSMARFHRPPQWPNGHRRWSALPDHIEKGNPLYKTSLVRAGVKHKK